MHINSISPTPPSRPDTAIERDLTPIYQFVQAMQEAIDTGDANLFNRNFADDVLWGSPFGAVAEGYALIHGIHSKMFSSVPAQKGAATYTVEHSRFVSEDVAIAFVRRTSSYATTKIDAAQPGGFDELALLVLVRRENEWWLSAAQHVPDRREVYAR